MAQDVTRGTMVNAKNMNENQNSNPLYQLNIPLPKDKGCLLRITANNLKEKKSEIVKPSRF